MLTENVEKSNSNDLVSALPSEIFAPPKKNKHTEMHRAIASEHGISYAFMNHIGSVFVAPDEMVQGVLVNKGISMIYGNSNVGKTFVAIDLACAIAEGKDWLGKKTEQGIVLYLAAESPDSVRCRCQAYMSKFDCTLENLAIVDSQVNLFTGEKIVERIVELIKEVEAQRGMKVRLVIGDTLSMLSIGANENTSDMAIVMDHANAIRHLAEVHFMVVHHTGKDAAAKARGWSGIRAMIDTEIELFEEDKQLAMLITKQRDLNSKGTLIGFSLEPIVLGITKFGDQATTCTVIPSDVMSLFDMKPPKLGGLESRILEFISSKAEGVMKMEVKNHLPDQQRQSLERSQKSLVKKGLIVEHDGRYFDAKKLNEAKPESLPISHETSTNCSLNGN